MTSTTSPDGLIPIAPDPDLLVLLRDLTDGLAIDLEVSDVAESLIDGCLRHTVVGEAGILIADQDGILRILAASSHLVTSLELLALQAEEGPCLDAHRSGEVVSSRDLRADRARWPRFSPAALDGGVNEAHSLPLRLRERTIGALNLFVMGRDCLGPEELVLAEILAGAAALGIITRRHIGEHVALARQLQAALDSRVVIEQAKGIVAAKTGLDMARSFDVMRRQARHERRPLRQIAEEMVRSTVPS